MTEKVEVEEKVPIKKEKKKEEKKDESRRGRRPRRRRKEWKLKSLSSRSRRRPRPPLLKFSSPWRLTSDWPSNRSRLPRMLKKRCKRRRCWLSEPKRPSTPSSPSYMLAEKTSRNLRISNSPSRLSET